MKALASTSVNSITYAGDSIAVIGTQAGNGFYIWNYKRKTLVKHTASQPVDAAEANIVNATCKDKQNRVWVLGNKRITLYNPVTGTAKSINLVNRNTHTDYKLFFDVCEAGGYFWIAAYGSGLIQLDHNFDIRRVFTVKDGLSNTGIYKVFPVQDSLIYMSTNYGLSVLNLQSHVISTYYKEDGLHSNAFEQGCGASRNGKIYAGGINGFTIIDPVYFAPNNIPPTLYLNHVQMETESGFVDKSDQSLKTMKVPGDEMQTIFSFSALNYSNPSRVKYAYKIVEVNNNWIHMGNQNFISIRRMYPGKYTLRVISANENNVWNTKPLEITLVYPPRWYQTGWFKIVVAAGILALLYGLYTYRIGQLKEQQKIRKDIAADLHDDIGSILNTVKVFTHLARRELGSERYLIQIEEALTQAVVAFRDMLWILDDSHDTIHEFAERVKKYVIPVASATGIDSSFIVDSDLYNRVMSKAEKRNILLIVKECVHNCIKYAQCKSIRIEMAQVNRKMAILIYDDGNGFNVSTTASGMGLKNIQYRAEQIGYTAEFISSPQEGTLVKVAKK
ncbi:MAG: hypothetical protein INR73_03065 [Williamsia sp.]|nr:hypothetical protein [Williamsia sp.]